jgi:hypothetical protein
MSLKLTSETKTVKKPVSFEIKESIAVLSANEAETMEFNVVSWNKRPEKYDIRSWYVDENGDKQAKKGVTLTDDEIIALYEALKKRAES